MSIIKPTTFVLAAVLIAAPAHADFKISEKERAAAPPESIALAFSGGGMRSAIASIAALDFVMWHRESFIPQHKSRDYSYVSALSGGAWGTLTHGFNSFAEGSTFSALHEACKAKQGWGHGSAASMHFASWTTAVRSAFIDPLLHLTSYIDLETVRLYLAESRTDATTDMARLFVEQYYGFLKQNAHEDLSKLEAAYRSSTKLDFPSAQAHPHLHRTMMMLARASKNLQLPRMLDKSPRILINTVIEPLVPESGMPKHWCDFSMFGVSCPTLAPTTIPLDQVKIAPQAYAWAEPLNKSIDTAYLFGLTGFAVPSFLATVVPILGYDIGTHVLPWLSFDGQSASYKAFDAGVHVNLPILPLLYKERKVWTVLAFDHSEPGGKRNVLEESVEQLRANNEWCLAMEKANPGTMQCAGTVEPIIDTTNNVVYQTYGTSSGDNVQVLVIPLAGKTQGIDLIKSYPTMGKTTYTCDEMKTLYDEVYGRLEVLAPKIQGWITKTHQ